MDYMLMPLRRYVDFSGRSRRMEYWMWTLFQVLVYFAVLILAMVAGGGAALFGAGDPNAIMAAGGVALLIFVVYALFLVAVFIPSLAVAVRRLHDTDRTGWWILAPLAPYLVVLGGGVLIASSPDLASLGGILVMLGMAATMILGLVVLIFYFLEGTRGPNRFGPDPKAAESDRMEAVV